jgi:hypothetical protein
MCSLDEAWRNQAALQADSQLVSSGIAGTTALMDT